VKWEKQESSYWATLATYCTSFHDIREHSSQLKIKANQTRSSLWISKAYSVFIQWYAHVRNTL